MRDLYDTNLDRNFVERETEKAILVRIPNGVTGFHDRKVWLPKSQIAWVAPGNFSETLHVPLWLARQNGL